MHGAREAQPTARRGFMAKEKAQKKDIGLGVSPPKEKCEDKLCAWHGTLSARGRAFEGIVTSARSAKTAIVRWGYTRYVPKFERYERRSSRVTAHNPSCIKAKEGDTVVIVECRPISKTKKFVVVSKSEAKLAQKQLGRLEKGSKALAKGSKQTEKTRPLGQSGASGQAEVKVDK